MSQLQAQPKEVKFHFTQEGKVFFLKEEININEYIRLLRKAKEDKIKSLILWNCISCENSAEIEKILNLTEKSNPNIQIMAPQDYSGEEVEFIIYERKEGNFRFTLSPRREVFLYNGSEVFKGKITEVFLKNLEFMLDSNRILEILKSFQKSVENKENDNGINVTIKI